MSSDVRETSNQIRRKWFIPGIILGCVVLGLYSGAKEETVHVKAQVQWASRNQPRWRQGTEQLRMQVRNVGDNAGDNVMLSFKIIQFADLHLTSDSDFPCLDPPEDENENKLPCFEAMTLNWMQQIMDIEKPDFVVFTGDQVTSTTIGLSERQIRDSIHAYSNLMAKYAVPWATIFGNHDEGVSYIVGARSKLILRCLICITIGGVPRENDAGNYGAAILIF